MKTAKIGRNDPCPCGTGKKYKRCCEGKAAEKTTFLTKWIAVIVRRARVRSASARRAIWAIVVEVGRPIQCPGIPSSLKISRRPMRSDMGEEQGRSG